MNCLFIEKLPIHIHEKILHDKFIDKFSVFGSCSCIISTKANVREAMVEYSYSDDARRAFHALNQKSMNVSNYSWKLEIADPKPHSRIFYKKERNKNHSDKSEEYKNSTFKEVTQKTQIIKHEANDNNKHQLLNSTNKYYAKRTRSPEEISLIEEKKTKSEESQSQTEKELSQSEILDANASIKFNEEMIIKNEYSEVKEAGETNHSPTSRYSINEIDIEDPKYDF